MTINGKNYRLSKHGRSRFIERSGFAPDCTIILTCINNPRAIWKLDKDGFSFRLVTYLDRPKHEVAATNS